MKNITTSSTLLAAAGLVAASVSLSQAQPYYVTGSGLTPSWSPGTAAYEMTGGPTVYTLSTATAGTPYHDFKITGASWSDPSYPNNDVRTMTDANGSNTFYFFPGTTADGWSPLNNRVGFADPGSPIEVAGDFNGWSGGTGYQLDSIGNGVYSNSIVIATAGTYGFKFRTLGSWSGINIGADFAGGDGNAYVTTTNSPQTIPFQLDLPNGRWLVGQLAPPPVTNQVVFAVDMSSQVLLGNFTPGSDSVYVSGSFNGWAGTGASALALKNDPIYGGNSNIYYGTNTFIGAPGSIPTEYKFTSSASAFSGTSGYEPRSANRSFALLNTNGTLLLAVVSFGDP